MQQRGLPETPYYRQHRVGARCLSAPVQDRRTPLSSSGDPLLVGVNRETASKIRAWGWELYSQRHHLQRCRSRPSCSAPSSNWLAGSIVLGLRGSYRADTATAPPGPPLPLRTAMACMARIVGQNGHKNGQERRHAQWIPHRQGPSRAAHVAITASWGERTTDAGGVALRRCPHSPAHASPDPNFPKALYALLAVEPSALTHGLALSARPPPHPPVSPPSNAVEQSWVVVGS